MLFGENSVNEILSESFTPDQSGLPDQITILLTLTIHQLCSREISLRLSGWVLANMSVTLTFESKSHLEIILLSRRASRMVMACVNPLNLSRKWVCWRKVKLRLMRLWKRGTWSQSNGNKLLEFNAIFLVAGEIKMNVQAKTYIITVTTYQMAILLLFNDGQNLSFALVEFMPSLFHGHRVKKIKKN